MTNKVDPKLIEQAKERYFNDESVSSIARDLGVNRLTIQNYVNKSWKEEKALMAAELFQELARSKKSQFVKMTQSAIKVLTRALENMANRDEAPTVREAKDVSSVMEALDKITRLDEAKPTEIIANEKPITVIELKEKLSVDPFLELEDAEVIDEESSSKKSDTTH
jgi:hypothetical protein